LLEVDVVPRFHEGAYPHWQQANPSFVLLDLFGHPDDHDLISSAVRF
jgi:hypothetical protein